MLKQTFMFFSITQQADSNRSSPILENATTTQDPMFVTAQGSSFISDCPGDSSSFYSTECQSKEELAGSYHYTASGATPPRIQAEPAGPSIPNGEVWTFCLES